MPADVAERRQPPGAADWIARLRTAAEPERRDLLAQGAAFHSPETVVAIHDQVVQSALLDVDDAERLAEAARWIAEKLDEPYARAVSSRASGHACYARGRYADAVRHYDAALELFERLGRDADVGRTLSSSLQSLIYLGRYDRAVQSAERARQVFLRLGDRLRLARLDSNTGNILYRQDRYADALALYHRAYEAFLQLGEPRDVAAVLSNMAVCSISLNDFARALEFYREAREWCGRHAMPLLVAEADYNIAYLHYLRGDYMRALDLYRVTREHCGRVGDVYHEALCDLDQSDIYLELNLHREGGELARRACKRFNRLGMGYEQAKALTNQAVAAGRLGDGSRALRLLREARKLFLAQRNRIWPALVDLQRALALFSCRRYTESRVAAEKALRVFVKLPAAGKAAFCELLLGRLAIEAGDFERARDTCRSALRRLELSESPWLGFHLRFVLGRADEELGDRAAALRQYQAAAESVERLRSGLACDELKIAFFQDKAAVYESLVALSLESREPACESAFTYMEQAKSRGLADLVAFHAQAVAGTGPAAVRLRELRQDLNARYHRLDLAECTISTSAETRRLIRQQARECENEIGRALADVHASDQESASLHGCAAVDLPSIRAAIPCDAAVLEYFLARDTVYACVLDRQRLRIRRAAGVPRVRGLLRLLQFQMGKLRLGGPDTRSEAATRAHLRELYDELVAPVRDLLQASHLVVVPHGFLHYLPFHALDDGRLHLLDAYTFSYAPSAGVYARCMLKTPAFENRSLVLALSDTRTPFVHEEARAAAAALPNARLFLDEAATEQRLREHGRSRFVHIATHGVFRRDNPMFSSVRLGNSHLNLVDFYDLPLSSELVTLSGCSTGLSAVLGGDELVGMVRGLLYAGAHGVMVTLWDVHDRTTAHFMASFYKSLGAGQGKAAALRAAMQDLRGRHPHPYYWAPFVLVGKHL